LEEHQPSSAVEGETVVEDAMAQTGTAGMTGKPLIESDRVEGTPSMTHEAITSEASSA